MQGIIFKCPNCDSNLTHQNKIEIFAGADEDAKGIHTIVDIDSAGPFDVKPGIKVKMDDDISQCPGRGSAIIITFRCEECSKKSFLTILQHRGETMIFTTENC